MIRRISPHCSPRFPSVKPITPRVVPVRPSARSLLTRNEDDKDAVRKFLTGQVNSKKKSVQLAAINGLGTLGDPKAIGVLETFASASKDESASATATRAIATIRAGRKPADDFKGLRQEVLDLQKTTRDLRKQLDGLKTSEAKTNSATNSVSAKSKKTKPAK